MALKPIVFVASPLAGPNTISNVEFAKTICRRISLETGATPIAPHLLFPRFLDDNDPHERGLGIAYCSSILALAQFAGFFIPRWCEELSTGMRLERAECFKRQIDFDLGFDYDAETMKKRPAVSIDDLIAKIARRFPK